ncbi:ABC transporter ATP-binding protein [bacterium]|nr:ABC transporter ATP-binding protein [bacterium]
MKKFKPKATNWWQKLKRFITINVFVQQFRYRTLRWWYWVELSINLLDRLTPTVNTFIFGLIINDVQRYVTGAITSLTNLFWYITISTIFSLFSRISVSLANRFNWFYSVYDIDIETDRLFMNKLTYLNWEHIENPKMEKRINRILNRATDYIRRLADLHIDILATSITLISTLFLITAPWWVYLLTIVKQIPSIFFAANNARIKNMMNDNLQNDYIKQNAVFQYFRNFTTLLEIKTARGHEFLKSIYNSIAASIRSKHLNREKKVVWPYVFIAIYENLISAGISLYYLLQVLFNGMLFGTFQYTTSLINQVSANIYGIITKMNSSIEYYYYVVQAYDFLQLENKRSDGIEELKTDHIDIEFRNVWFKYPGSKRYSLRGVTFRIEDNERLAIVGENGAGKSTFLKLLNRLYVPTKGEILVNGIPIQDYSATSYNSKISVVTQDFARYGTLTAAQNIAIYDKDLIVDIQRVKVAAKLADIDSIIEKLPEGYDTYLTKRLEDGTDLSTGQWQRIAVARQFYANRPLVVLDEPTSAIDPIAEAKIFANLYEHVKDKTVIVVSHRYNTVRAAQKILVFNNGQIIEQGTHDELLALKGYYATAFDVQQAEKKL